MQITCPSCGAKLEILPGLINYVCEYCNTILFVEKNEINALKKTNPVIPFPTRFEVNKVFYGVKDKSSNNSLKGYLVNFLSEEEFSQKKIKDYLIKIYVFGQIRYLTDVSFFDKFFVRILDSKIKHLPENLFIEEDEGQIKFYSYEMVEDKGTFEELYNTTEWYKDGFFIQEKGTQNINGLKGGFNFNIENISGSKYLNLIGSGGTKFLLEKLNNYTILFGTAL